MRCVSLWLLKVSELLFAVFVRYMKKSLFLLCLVLPVASLAGQKADLVRVNKSDSMMYLIKDGRILQQYRVVFGANPTGHKQQEGDERTPEGTYVLDYKKPDSAYYKAIRISYPNAQDTRQAKARGVSPGGQIMIHGQRNGLGWLSFITQRFNWTNGCIAVTDAEMEQIWQAVDTGTRIEILP